MSVKKKLTVVDKLLIATLKLEKKGKTQFSVEDLVVAAWESFPDTFGLKGYVDDKGVPGYPDSNRVCAEIMGKSATIRIRGYLDKVGRKTYQLTESGRELAMILSRGEGKGERLEKISLSPESLRHLGSLLNSRIVNKTKSGASSKITFFDACMFWGISAGSTAVELSGKLSNLESLLKATRRYIGQKEMVFDFRKGSLTISVEDIDFLEQINAKLQEQFKDELSIISNRTSER